MAAKYPWYDITRVGVYGGSAGGQNAAGAVLFHPEFYDAAVASSGCHDNRMDETWWNELWMGEMGPHYAASSNTEHGANLKGKLFLAVGEMDTNVDPSSTMQLVNALIVAARTSSCWSRPRQARRHGPDGNRRRNDFFIRSLYGSTPPDWNGGASVQSQATSSDSQSPEPSDSPDAEGAPAYGFIESPADSHGPWWWW